MGASSRSAEVTGSYNEELENQGQTPRSRVVKRKNRVCSGFRGGRTCPRSPTPRRIANIPPITRALRKEGRHGPDTRTRHHPLPEPFVQGQHEPAHQNVPGGPRASRAAAVGGELAPYHARA